MTIPGSDSSSNQRQRQFPITPLFSTSLLYKQMPFGQGYSKISSGWCERTDILQGFKNDWLL